MQHQLQGKVALVTGGNSGIGLATVELFLSNGAQVIAVDRNKSSQPETENFLPLQCDVSSEQDVSKSVDAAVKRFGTIHILCNIAGIMDHKTLPHEITTEEWHRIMNVNLNGPFYMTRAVIPHMLTNDTSEKGCIINTCSGAAVRGANAGTIYTTSKHALLGFSRSTAWLYRNQGIRCNVVHPGATRTNIMANSGSSHGGVVDPKSVTLESIKDKIKDPDLAPYLGCCPGFNDPEDVAVAYLFLATAKKANGVEVPIDSGWLLA